MRDDVKLCDSIYWVGAVDYNVRNFHGYTTEYGTTYNAYLIIDEKITLIDTVKVPFASEFIKNISKIIDPSMIDYVIANHVEPDHSGSLPVIMELCKNAVVITTAQGKAGLKKHYGEYDYKVVKQGDTLSLGKRTLSFIPVPMLHWPDSMVTYLHEEKILFSNDAFGQHFASSKRLDTQVDIHEVLKQAAKYYANIVFPFGSQAAKALTAASGLEIKTIAPSHGVIWTKFIPDILKKYADWSQNKTETKAVVVYDTMWHSTEAMANAVADGFAQASIPVKLIDLKTRHISDILLDILDAKYICVGSPTLNNNIMPTTSSFLTYLKGLSPKNRQGIAFGSYGWSGQSIGQIEDVFKEMDVELLIPSVKYQYVPDKEALTQLEKDIFDAVYVEEDITDSPKLNGNPLFKASYGLYVLSAKENDKDNACIINTFLQITSSDPVVCVITVNKQNFTHDMIMKTKKFNLSVLTTETPAEAIQHFGYQSGKVINKFENFNDCSRSTNGLTYLNSHSNAFMSFDVTETIDFVSHTMFKATLTESKVFDHNESVTYSYYQQYIKPKTQPNQKQGYRCNVCGYIYEGESLPQDYICPICKHGVVDFIKI